MIDVWPDGCGSIGYEGRSLAELCEALRGAGVEVLVDVRERAWSYRPEFRKTALASALDEGGIDYVHFKEGGNPFRPRPGDETNLAECEAKFREHLADFPQVLDELDSLVRGRRAALFCYEARTDRCHRGVLLEEAARDRTELVVYDL